MRPGSVSTTEREPPVTPGFEHINRYWDRVHNCHAAKILPGEYYVTANTEIITTVLGSCVSACVRDPKLGIGGMNHFMLPHGRTGDGRWVGTQAESPHRYGTFAMEHMINDILKMGCKRERLEIKVFGGANVLPKMTDVGKRNIAFVQEYVTTEGFRLSGSDLGDVFPRKVVYFPTTGRVLVKKLRTMHNDTIIRREETYLNNIDNTRIEGEVELFE